MPQNMLSYLFKENILLDKNVLFSYSLQIEAYVSSQYNIPQF